MLMSMCPGPCGRLTTAATFVCIAVIQVIAGLILIKSQFVYLLSAPNFWTAASNLSVGCLMGISATVWKDISKRTATHTTRRNVLYALAGSALVLNAVTAAILILGEGNTLLSIHLESKNRRSSQVLTSEILAYAYATSVCSPVIAVVVSIVYLSDIFSHKNDKDGDMPHLKSILKIGHSYPYDWVYDKKLGTVVKPNKRFLNPALSLKYSKNFEDTPIDEGRIFRSNSISSIGYLGSTLSTEIQTSADESSVKPLNLEKSPMNISGLSVSFADKSYGIKKPIQKCHSTGNRIDIMEDNPFRFSSTENKKMPSNPVHLKRQGAFKRIGLQEGENQTIPCDLNNSSNSPYFFQGNNLKRLEVSVNPDVLGKRSTHSEVFAEETSILVHDAEILSDVFYQNGDVCGANESHLLDYISAESENCRSNREDLPTVSVHTSSETTLTKNENCPNVDKIQDLYEGEQVKSSHSEADKLQRNLAGQVVAVQLDRSNSKGKTCKLIPVSVPVLDDKLAKDKGFRQSMRVDPAQLEKRGVTFSSFSRKKFDCAKMVRSELRGASNSCNFVSPQSSGYGSTLDESLPGTSGMGQYSVDQKISQANVQCKARQRKASREDMIEELNSALLNLKEKMDETLISDLINEVAFHKALKESLQEENF